MIILLMTVQIYKQKKSQNRYKQMYNLDKDKTVLKVLASVMYDSLIGMNSDDTIVDHSNL